MDRLKLDEQGRKEERKERGEDGGPDVLERKYIL